MSVSYKEIVEKQKQGLSKASIKWYFKNGLTPPTPGKEFIQRIPVKLSRFGLKAGDKMIEAANKGVKERPESGFKLHVSIDVNQMADAWDALEDYLVEDEGLSFKVPSVDASIMDNSGKQKGKTITVYMSEKQKFRGGEIADNISNKLSAAGVSPGVEVDGDAKHSNFVYYRHDSVPKEKDSLNIANDKGYIAASSVRAYNASVAPEKRVNPANPYGAVDGFGVDIKDSPKVSAEDLNTVLSDYSSAAPDEESFGAKFDDDSTVTASSPEQGLCLGCVHAVSDKFEDAHNMNGMPMTRIPVGDMSEDSLRDIRTGLEQAGIKSSVAESQSKGTVLRVASDDYDKFKNMFRPDDEKLKPIAPAKSKKVVIQL